MRQQSPRLGRFEKKILGAMTLVALAPLVGALYLGQIAVDDAYAAGVNDHFGAELRRSVDVHRRYLEALRETADRTADAVAGSADLRDLLRVGEAGALAQHLERELDRLESTASLRLREGEETLAFAERQERLGEDVRELMQERTLQVYGREIVLEIHATAPRSVFEDFQRVGTEAELYERLLEQGGYVSSVYLAVYVGFLALVIVLALILGAVLSRRVTRRVTVLADATRRLGGGDMHVTVPRESQDEVGELIEAFNTMVEDLRRSRERIDYLRRIGAWQEFARRLAHEIKNPLTPIQLAAQELHRSYEGDDARYAKKLDDARSIIEEEVETLRRLVGEFSSFARLPEADLESADLRVFLTDLAPALENIVADVAVEAHVQVEPGTNGARARFDAMMLKRCLDNLVRNGLQAIRDDGGREVRVSLKPSGDEAMIYVDDDGPGVPEDERSTIFDPYVTSKTDGTGLGLPIVKKVILEHEGSIECDASPLGGARFVIRLPLESP
ncbi:MAG: ATP-binding protein [Myxococcota bacterium]